MSSKQKKEGIINKLGNRSKAFGERVMTAGEVVKTNRDPSYSYRKEKRDAKNLTKEKLKKPIKRMFTTDQVLKNEGIKVGDRFESIDEFIEILSVIPDNLDKFFMGLEYQAQEGVDFVCEEASSFVNKKLESIKNNVVSYLRDRFAGASALSSKLEIIKNPPTSPDKAVSYLSDYVDQHKWTQVIKLIADFATKLPPKLTKLMTALNKLASYRPPQMEVNLDKFQIKPPSISTGDILK